jgi:hypothetical protein
LAAFLLLTRYLFLLSLQVYVNRVSVENSNLSKFSSEFPPALSTEVTLHIRLTYNAKYSSVKLSVTNIKQI